MLDLLELGAGWENQCQIEVFILELLENIPHRNSPKGICQGLCWWWLKRSAERLHRDTSPPLALLFVMALTIQKEKTESSCWEVRKSLFSSTWSFQQPGDGIEGSCIQTWPQEIIHGCGNGLFKRAFSFL